MFLKTSSSSTQQQFLIIDSGLANKNNRHCRFEKSTLDTRPALLQTAMIAVITHKILSATRRWLLVSIWAYSWLAENTKVQDDLQSLSRVRNSLPWTVKVVSDIQYSYTQGGWADLLYAIAPSRAVGGLAGRVMLLIDCRCPLIISTIGNNALAS